MTELTTLGHKKQTAQQCALETVGFNGRKHYDEE